MSESNPQKTGGLWARLFGMQDDEPDQHAPVVVPEPEPEPEPVVAAEPMVVAVPEEPAPPPIAVAEPAPAAPPQLCQACGTPRKEGLAYCYDCGWMFPANAANSSPATSSSREAAMTARLQNRFEKGPMTGEREGLQRFRGTDHTTGQAVIIVAGPMPIAVAEVAAEIPTVDVQEDIMPGFDDDVPVAIAIPIEGSTAWPSIGWEKALLEKANQPALPKVLAHFSEGDTEYLVLEVPTGESLWDAWDDPDSDAFTRYSLLQKIAAALQGLHQNGVIFEGIRPDVIVVDHGQPRFTDISDLLPFPLAANTPIKATLYTAPELILTPAAADARSDLYSFGAMLYSLEYLHHPLEEKDFERQFMPLQITERFPDVHPLFLRLINKTFVRDVNTRFPTDEMTKTDPSGFTELIKTLAIGGQTFDKVRLDIAAWTTTGMVRTGNEDAFTVLHGVDARLDELHEYSMILLCDGMGGYDAGEVAAALTINEMRKFLLAQPMFAALGGKDGPKEAVDVKKYQEVLHAALKHANREVYTAARTPGKGKKGMGCTAECVYVDSRQVIAGHVGDSRVYHLHRGRLIQLTRDQTFVNRMVELGQLSAAEAEDHPRKNELQQAIGGQPDVNPGVYAGKLMRGDWVLVCSDGLSNHITNAELEKMLAREAANSAEEAARRLLNLVNLRGATDNATVVVVRAS